MPENFNLVLLLFFVFFTLPACNDGSGGNSIVAEFVNSTSPATGLPDYMEVSSDTLDDESVEVSCEEETTTEGGYLSLKCRSDGNLLGETQFTCQDGIVMFDGGTYDSDCVNYTCSEDAASIGSCIDLSGGPVP